MNMTTTELHAEVARYERLARSVTDTVVREKLQQLADEAKEQLAALAQRDPLSRDLGGAAA